jgi:hypothetical protein
MLDKIEEEFQEEVRAGSKLQAAIRNSLKLEH